MKYRFSVHANTVIKERNIKADWIRSAITDPEKVELDKDGTAHYIKSIQEYECRYLRVVINPAVDPCVIVTVFFDRRLGRKNES